MSERVSHSLLDPWIGPPIKSIYRFLPIPRRFPPEGIIAAGHLMAMVGAIGFAFSAEHWWGGLLVALGVAGNHFADCIDGTHARSTGQCRNGGELLDHFTDPLSFAYWVAGWSVACHRLDWGIAAVVIIYATSVLTNIKAKLVGEFTLARFGPTEFKTILVGWGVIVSVLTMTHGTAVALNVSQIVFASMIVVGIVQLIVNLILAVRDVNRDGQPPDTSEWVVESRK